MGAKGEIKTSRQGEGIQVLCGFALVDSIVAINPTNAQKAKMFGFEEDDEREEPKYVGETEDGDAKLSLDIYFKLGNGDGSIRKHRFFLENVPIEFEEEKDDEKVQKTKYVNQVGQIVAVEDGTDLPQWFTEFQKWDDDVKKFVPTGEKKTYRKCLKGEDGLMRFLREALNINYELPTADLAYNYKKLFKGDVKELLLDLQGDLFRKFVVETQVTTSQDGTEHYEKLWLPNNNFGVPTLPEECIKYINNGCRFPTGFLGKKWKKYKETYEKWPPTGYAPLEPIRPYDASDDVAAGETTKKPEKAVASDDDDY